MTRTVSCFQAEHCWLWSPSLPRRVHVSLPQRAERVLGGVLRDARLLARRFWFQLQSLLAGSLQEVWREGVLEVVWNGVRLLVR